MDISIGNHPISADRSVEPMFKQSLAMQAILIRVRPIIAIILPVKHKTPAIKITVVIPMLVIKRCPFIQIGQIPLATVMSVAVLTAGLRRDPEVTVIILVLFIVLTMLVFEPSVPDITPQLFPTVLRCVMAVSY